VVQRIFSVFARENRRCRSERLAFDSGLRRTSRSAEWSGFEILDVEGRDLLRLAVFQGWEVCVLEIGYRLTPFVASRDVHQNQLTYNAHPEILVARVSWFLRRRGSGGGCLRRAHGSQERRQHGCGYQSTQTAGMWFERHESESVSRRDLGVAHSSDGDDLSEGRRAQSGIDGREVGVIENVVSRKSKFEALHFLDLDGLRKRHVKGDGPGPDDDV